MFRHNLNDQLRSDFLGLVRRNDILQLSARKQIILSSDKPPKDMETLEERIRSRFEWGLLADIGYPDYETRMAILRRKEEIDGFHLDDEVLDYIAINIKSNIRELEGALNKLIAFSNLEDTVITMDVAVRELQNIISPDKPKEITPQLDFRSCYPQNLDIFLIDLERCSCFVNLG